MQMEDGGSLYSLRRFGPPAGYASNRICLKGDSVGSCDRRQIETLLRYDLKQIVMALFRHLSFVACMFASYVHWASSNP